MSRLLEDRENHALVQHDDGTVELIPWSDTNRLVYKHGLEGLLKDGDEILVIAPDDGPIVRVLPEDDAMEFTLEVGDDEFHIGQHQKSELLEVLRRAYEADDGPAVEPFIEYAGVLMDVKANPNVVDQFADLPLFQDSVEVQSDGWLINDHLLLTYDNEFYHPDTTRKSRTGGVVEGGANKNAYELRFHNRDNGQSELPDFGNNIGESEDVVDFIARALWAVSYAPEDL